MFMELETLKQIAKAISSQFGNDCETVIYDLCTKEIGKSIVFVENGHVSGKKIGDSPDQRILDMLNDENDSVSKDRCACLLRTRSGRALKCSTLFIKDSEGIIKYIFEINHDITNLLVVENSIKELTGNNEEEKQQKPKKLTLEVNSILDELISQASDLIGIPAALMTKEDKIRFINYLNDAGAFLITRSGDKVSEFLGISKYTLYNYVNINK